MTTSYLSTRSYPNLHSFPTRRSSDLNPREDAGFTNAQTGAAAVVSPALMVERRKSRRFTASSPDRFESRSEEHTSELQSHSDLVCRLLLEKKKQKVVVFERTQLMDWV